MHDRHADPADMLGIADTRQLQDVRRADRARRQDYLARRVGPLDGPVARKLSERAKTVLFVTRPMASGYTGMDNEPFYRDKTMMLFGETKKMRKDIVKNSNSACQRSRPPVTEGSRASLRRKRSNAAI